MLRSMMVVGVLFLVACGDDTGGAGGGTGGDGSGGTTSGGDGGSTSSGDGGGDGTTTSAGGGTSSSTGTTGSTSSTSSTTGGGGDGVVAACEEYKVFAEGLADELACGVQDLDCADPENGFDACPDVWVDYFDCSRENTTAEACVCDEDGTVSCDNPEACEEEFNALLECLSA